MTAQSPPAHFIWECATSDQAPEIPEGAAPETPICTDPEVVKYIRVAFHFIRAEHFFVRQIFDDCGFDPPIYRTYVGYGNFAANNDGNGDLSYNGYQRAEDIVAKANEELANNAKQWRETPGVSYPAEAPPVPLRYVLVGVYFHANQSAFSGNPNTTALHNLYNVGGDDVLDVYCINNDQVSWNGTGWGGSSANKYVFLNDYEIYLKPNCREWSKTLSGFSLNHEIGHSLSLSHTWNIQDQCDDTPLGYIYDKVLSGGGCLMNQYANCWVHDPNIPGCPRKPCDDWPKISNNIMDYNGYYYHAYTECQIGRIQASLSGLGNTYIHSCNGCDPSNAFFSLRDPIKICPPEQGGSETVWLEGQACHNENRYLIEICAVEESDPETCVDDYWNSTWQTGTVGRINLSVLYNFGANRVYRIKLEVDNTECPGSHEYVRLLHTEDCDVPVPPCCFEMAAAPNPFQQELTVYWDAPAESALSLSLVNLTNSQVTTLRSSSTTPAGLQQQTFYTGAVSSGNYALRAIYNGEQYSLNLVKF